MTENLTVLALSKVGQNMPKNSDRRAKTNNIAPKVITKKKDMIDTKREKFKTLAENRVNTILKNLQLIGNLSNRSNYEYSVADLNKIKSAIMREFKSMKDRFESGGKKKNYKFKL